MTNAKVRCAFCGQTNTKVEGIYSGIFGQNKVGEQEVIDHDRAVYRCTGCGDVLCYSCMKKMGGKKTGLFTTKFVCPDCGSKMIQI